MNKCFLAFRLSTRENKLKLLEKILSKEYICEIKKDALYYTKEDKRHMIIFATHLPSIKQNDLVNILDEFSCSNVDEFDIICSDSINLNLNIYKTIKINIITKEQLYLDYFKKTDTYPDTDILNDKVSKFNWKLFISSLFVPSKAKGYFFCAIILIFSSVLLPYNWYYIVFGSVLLMFAIISKILPKFLNKS